MVLIRWFNNKIRPHLISGSSSSSREGLRSVCPFSLFPTCYGAPGSGSSPDHLNQNYDFPEDILIQIFCRLPADRLQLLKTVCHDWRSIISSPYFGKLHLRHHSDNPITILMFSHDFGSQHSFGIYDPGLGSPGIMRRKTKVRLISLPATESNFKKDCGFPSIRLIGSCDGLLMLDKFNHRNRRILILNPITGEKRLIRYPKGNIVGYVCGIFYDRFQQEHKLLHVSKIDLQLKVYHIFRFKKRGWTRIETTSTTPSSSLSHVNTAPPCMHIIPPVVVADALHWIVDDARESLSKVVVMAFKIDTKEIHYFPHPVVVATSSPDSPETSSSCDTCVFEFMFSSYQGMQLVQTNGKLCFCHTLCQRGVIELWILEEYGDWSSWVKRFKVKLPRTDVFNVCCLSDVWGSTIITFPGQDVIAIKWTHRGMYLYNLVTHKSRWIDDDIVSSIIGGDSYRFVAFHKSLLSPKITYY